ncbi:hypothetical protein OE810_11000 [Rhodobacteraceae bacterium XHP0102]|nr:hypothetical protein [Rhodobacteraceae bacterium XHP0102]
MTINANEATTASAAKDIDPDAVTTRVRAWEASLNKAAKRSALPTLAVSLAACGSDDSAGVTAEEVQTIVNAALAAQDEGLTAQEVQSIVDTALAAQDEGLTAQEVQSIVDTALAGQYGGAVVLTRLSENVVGTENDDYFIAPIAGAVTGDTIDGGDGFDTLEVFTFRNGSVIASNIEKFVLSVDEVSSRGGKDFSMAGFDDALEEIHLQYKTADRGIDLNEVQNNPQIHLYGPLRGDEPHDISWAEGAISEGDEINVTLHSWFSNNDYVVEGGLILGGVHELAETFTLNVMPLSFDVERPSAFKLYNGNSYENITTFSTFNITGQGSIFVIIEQSADWGSSPYLNNVTTFDFSENSGGVELFLEYGSVSTAFTMIGSSGNDVITVEERANEGVRDISLGDGNDTLVLRDEEGDYIINGGAGSDTVDYSGVGGLDSDTGITVDLSNQGTATSDVQAGDTDVGTHDFVDIENLVGTPGIDTLSGGAESNTLDGYEGDDTINGKGGVDRLIGGDGQDTLTGGAGNDTFVNLNIDDNDTDSITDFTTAEDDIELSVADLNALTQENTFSAGDTLGVDAGAFLQIIETDDVGAATVTATGIKGTLIYDSNTGNVIFDASGDTTYTDDGSTGFTDTNSDDIIFATLGSGGIDAIVAADFTLVA